jgi:hypothetical protein
MTVTGANSRIRAVNASGTTIGTAGTIVIVGTAKQLLQNFNPYHARVLLNSRWYDVKQLLFTWSQTNDSRLGLLVGYAPGTRSAQVLNADGSLNLALTFDIPHN